MPVRYMSRLCQSAACESRVDTAQNGGRPFWVRMEFSNTSRARSSASRWSAAARGTMVGPTYSEPAGGAGGGGDGGGVTDGSTGMTVAATSCGLTRVNEAPRTSIVPWEAETAIAPRGGTVDTDTRAER